MKGKVIKKTEPDALPPTGAIGEIRILSDSRWAFYPEKKEHRTNHPKFNYFIFEFWEIKVL